MSETIINPASSITKMVQTLRHSVVLAVNATTDITITWPKPFVDTNYTVVRDYEIPGAYTTGNITMRRILTKTATQLTFRVQNSSLTDTPTVIMHLVAFHD